MLGIVTLQKNIQNELGKLIKKLVKHITNPEEITEEDKEFISNLDYDGIEFPVQKKDFRKIEVKKKYALTYLVMRMSWFFQFMFQIKSFKTQWIYCF